MENQKPSEATDDLTGYKIITKFANNCQQTQNY